MVPFPRYIPAVALFLAVTAGAGPGEDGPNKDPWLPRCQSGMAAIEAQIVALEEQSPPHSIATVLQPLNRIETAIADGESFASLMENVHPDPEVREAASECATAYSDLGTRLSLSRPVYDAVSALDLEGAPEDTERYHSLTLQEFRLSGVDRDAATRREIRDLKDRLTQLGQEFDRNILEDVRHIEVEPEALAGLPEDFLASHPVQDNGKVRLSTRYVDTVPVYTYAHSDRVRRLLRQADRSRGYPENKAVLEKMLSLRHRLANLLGFDHYADLITSDKMIGSAANAREFIREIHGMAAPAAEREMEQLLARLREDDPEAERVQRWQATYLEERIRREQFDVDAASMRQYFPYGRVKAGILELVEQLFDVRIRPWDTDTWHEAVEAYEMHRDGELLGRFYLDMHPREGKYQHAAAFTNQVGVRGEQVPVSTLVCNFAGGGDPDELMEYSEVQTFLHEFGHLLHSLFGGHQRWARLSGIATEWDFVEAPSQMLEEWMYDIRTLQSFAINAEGEPIPADLVERIRAARHFGEGYNASVQMYYAALSLEYHSQDPEQFDLVDRMLTLEETYSPFPHQEGTYLFANLGHLNGYSALYYTYMWSKVIALDMFSRFQNEGLWNLATAAEYRDSVLRPGGAKPARELVRDFLGRPYNFEAFAERLAIQPLAEDAPTVD